MKTQLLQDFNDSRADHAGAGVRPEPQPASPEPAGVPPAPAAPAASAELEATVVPGEAAMPAPTAPPPAPTAPPPAPAARPSTRPRPAVWQRPQQIDADATVHYPTPVMPPAAPSPPPPLPEDVLAPFTPAPSVPPAPPSPFPPSPPPQPAQAQVQAADGTQPTAPLPGRARGFAPQPTASGLTPPLSDTTVREWPVGANAGGGDPDWLTERLARDVAVHDKAEWNGRWKTRLVSWGAAGVLLALVAGGGFWLYEQSRVEGALVVVANTNPAQEGNVLRADRPSEPLPAPNNTPAANADKSAAILAPVSALPPSTLPAARPEGPGGANAGSGAETGAGAVGSSAGPSTGSSASGIDALPPFVTDRTVKAVALGDDPVPPPKRQRNRERKQARPQQEARARVRDTEPSARQRREETLLQCRAHGYDERQCIQRGCEMTRYGFACKG